MTCGRARVARHIGKHMPGKPNVVSQNMPGAGSYTAAAHIYSAAPKDGTVMGIIARDAPLGPLTGQEGARFDATKISWLGTPTTETNVCIAYKNAKVKKAEDLFTTEIIMGDTGPGTGTHSYPKALNALLGHEDQVGRRLSVVVGRVPGHGARRSRGHLREPGQRPRQASGLGREEDRHPAVPGRRAAESRDQGGPLRPAVSPRTRTPRRRSSSSMPARASAAPSWRRPTCRPPC